MPIILRGVLPVLYTFRTATRSLVIPGVLHNPLGVALRLRYEQTRHLWVTGGALLAVAFVLGTLRFLAKATPQLGPELLLLAATCGVGGVGTLLRALRRTLRSK